MSDLPPRRPPGMTERERTVAIASFRSGWTAACMSMEKSLRSAGAPEDALVFLQEMAANAPTPIVSDKRDMTPEAMKKLEVVSIESVPFGSATLGFGKGQS